MIFVLAGILSFATAGFFVLKRTLSGLESKQEELANHLDFYDLDDGVRDTKELLKKRKEHYLELVENYYNLTTDLLHMIWGPHYSMGMVFPVENRRWQSYAASQQMYQCYLGSSLDADENSVLGDFGCGTGGPTRCIAQFTGAKIKAVNITKYHLKQMEKWNKEFHLDDRIELINSDYHDTPIESSSLDGVYMCESMAHSPDYKKLCREVFRVLKPGGKFTGFNWDLTEEYDENNPEHVLIRRKLERGLAIPEMVKMSVFAEALKEAGFEILKQRDHGEFARKLGAKPWWYIVVEDNLSERSSLSFFVYKIFMIFQRICWGPISFSIFTVIWFLEKMLLVPQGTAEADRLLMHSLCEGMQGGAKEGVFTPMHYWLAQKPYKNGA